VIPYKPIPFVNLLGIQVGIPPLMSTIGFLVFGYLVAREFRKQKIVFEGNRFLVFILLLILSSLGGGRIWYYFENWQGFRTLIIFFNPFVPGLTSYGMIIGGILFLVLWVKKNPIKGMRFSWQLAKFSDIAALYAPLFIAIYRVGCFFYGCCYGIRTSVPWAVHYIGTNINRHPTQLYEIGSALIVFALLKIFFGKEKTKKNRLGKRFEGETALWFLLLYGMGRFVIDFFRYYQSHYFGLAVSQWICVGILSVSIILLARRYGAIYFAKR
jgi:phosphatidylglycerol:prolipoprotein diacylglycerol transferase